MNVCMLCQRDMKKSKSQFGNGCINNIFKFLDMKKPARGKNKEQFLYKNIMNKTGISKINKEQKIWLTDRYLTYQYLDQLHYGNFNKLKEQINTEIERVNQIEKFEEMQYAFWQTVIEIGGRYADFKIAAEFLQHSLEEKPEDLYFSEGKIIEEIKQQEQFQKIISEIIEKYGNKNEFIFDSNEDKDFPISFSNRDLYFAINKAELKMIGKKQNKNWNLKIKLHDRYDYTNFKKLDDYYFDTSSVPKSIFSSTLYNLAYYSMKFKVMKEYNIDIQFEWNNFKVVK